MSPTSSTKRQRGALNIPAWDSRASQRPSTSDQLTTWTFTDSLRPPANKPKPNTRFLNNIIRDTNSHNQALLAKEAAESRARLESLATNEHREQKAKGVGGGDIRRRQLGDIAAILGNGGRRPKRLRTDDSRSAAKEPPRRRNTSSEEDEPTPKKRSRVDDNGRAHKSRDDESRNGERKSRDDQRHKTKNGAEDSEEEVEKRHSKEHRKRQHLSHDDGRKEEELKRPLKTEKQSRRRILEQIEDTITKESSKKKRRHRDDDSEEEERSRSHRHRHRRHRSRSPSQDRERNGDERRRRHRSRSPREHRDKDSHRTSHRKRSRSPLRSRKESSPAPKKDTNGPSKSLKPDYDSDPLESIIGPPPPPPAPAVRSRGRGTFSHLSGIDSRFSADYDPTADVQLDLDEENDWDQALEALRDRQKWKQQGADRLRAAGFTDDEIKKWEKGGEKREEDVKWAKKGEGREWDRGKVVDEEGAVSLEPSFGRLKDN
jgi:hypothetical protein